MALCLFEMKSASANQYGVRRFVKDEADLLYLALVANSSYRTLVLLELKPPLDTIVTKSRTSREIGSNA